MAKGLTYEQKKAVPRHLRGAGVRRYWCKHCERWESNSNCPKRPGYDEMIERQRIEAKITGRLGGIKWYYQMGGKQKLEEGYERWAEGPGKALMRMSALRTNAMLKANGGRAGPNNPFYGRKHSLETRLRMSTAISRAHNRLKQEDLERVVLAPVVPTSSSFDFFRRPTSNEPRDEFSGGEILERWNRGDDW